MIDASETQRFDLRQAGAGFAVVDEIVPTAEWGGYDREYVSARLNEWARPGRAVYVYYLSGRACRLVYRNGQYVTTYDEGGEA